MPRWLTVEYIGKSDISWHFCRCDSCRRLTVLSTYTTLRFAKLLNIPILPVGKFRIIDECSHCGNRGIATARKYAKERKHNLDLMMQGFSSDADDPSNCAHALHTLMVYDEESWFHDVQKSYGLRFEGNMRIQYLIAQGLSRFGEYQAAMTYCRKAIVLGAGKPAEELLSFCQTLLEASEGTKDLEALKVRPASMLPAFLPMATLTVSAAVCLILVGVSSMRNYKAWVVNGSLSTYSFTLDDQRYELEPGVVKQITLQAGEHELQTDNMEAKQFTYSVPFLKQLLGKQQLVINPDAMALLAVADMAQENAPKTRYSYSGQIRIFPELPAPRNGLVKIETDAERNDSICFYRPESHMEMVELMQKLGQEEAAMEYAQRALRMNPASSETESLLPIVLSRLEDADIIAFLRAELEVTPTLLSWHRHYQNYMNFHRPEYNLEREYTQRCNAYADEAASYYLLARVVENREHAYQLYTRSDKDHEMGGMGIFAIAHDLYIRGEFEKALPFSSKAMDMAPGNTTFSELNEDILLALRDYDTLLAKIQSSTEGLPPETRTERMIRYLTGAGYHQEAADLIAKSTEQHDADLARLNAIRYYTVGNIEYYLDCMTDMGNPHASMEAFLHRNEIQQADELISLKEDHPYWEHLVLYCAAMNQNKPEIAASNLQKAILETGTDTITRQRISRLLAGQDEAMETLIRSLDIDAAEKAVLCVALGYRYPELRQQLNEVAYDYNFIPAYPQLLIRKWVRTYPSASEEIAGSSDHGVTLPSL